MINDYSKQIELIDVEKVDKRINVIGCGALGSWIVFFLLKMGFKNIHVYDFDVVEEHNIPNQFFRENDIGKSKAEGAMELYKEFFNDSVEDRLTIHNTKLNESNSVMLKGYTISAVDSMKTRKNLFESTFKYGKSDLWIEGRISIYGAYVYTITDKLNANQIENYEKTFYEDEAAEVSACGVSQTALPSAVNCATMMIMQLISFINEEVIENEILYSIPQLITFNKKWK